MNFEIGSPIKPAYKHFISSEFRISVRSTVWLINNPKSRRRKRKTHSIESFTFGVCILSSDVITKRRGNKKFALILNWFERGCLCRSVWVLSFWEPKLNETGEMLARNSSAALNGIWYRRKYLPGFCRTKFIFKHRISNFNSGCNSHALRSYCEKMYDRQFWSNHFLNSRDVEKNELKEPNICAWAWITA